MSLCPFVQALELQYQQEQERRDEERRRRYNFLMTPYERNLMMRIQFSQLEINDPMQDDYYYHVRARPDVACVQSRACASCRLKLSTMMLPYQ